MVFKELIVLAAVIAVVQADVYMHNMRGSNNRLNEQNNDRTSDNRLFNSQNNGNGGYNVGDDATTAQTSNQQGVMKYYAGSVLRLEWTNQHGANNPNLNTQVIFQMMCNDVTPPYDNTVGSGLRDGSTTNQITQATQDDATVGRHETFAYYDDCARRQRNQGLFIADRTLDGNTARFTRQNSNGDASGFECEEERDYYPYWHPTPWKDIAVLTTNMTHCDMYQTESQNVMTKNYCSDPQHNNEEDCAPPATWESAPAHGWPAPECLELGYSRDNHLGNTLGGQTLAYNWTIPDIATAGNPETCVLRMRYNISTDDYDSWNTFSESNGDESPIKNNPNVNFGGMVGGRMRPINIQLALNTNQFGRTFQDRSHTFQIQHIDDAPPGTAPPAGGVLYNLNVRGRRGNIVQSYPSVEYDFVPNDLWITGNDRVHIQWTGSVNQPQNQAGNGQDQTDKSNIVCMHHRSENMPLTFNDPACTMFNSLEEKAKFASVGLYPGTTVDSELTNAPSYFDGGIVHIGGGVPGEYNYMCTLNNDFSNRAQKGTITVVA